MKRLFFITVIFAVALAMAGCTRPTLPSDTLRVGLGAQPASLDPALAQGVAEMRVLSALYEGLVAPSNDGRGVQPAGAHSWQVSADGLVYTFYLRPTARWSNGRPVIAEDYIYGWRRAMAARMAAPNAHLMDAIAGAAEYRKGNLEWSQVGIKALGAHTLQVRLAAPRAVFVQELTAAIYYPVAVGNFAGDNAQEKWEAATRRDTHWTQPHHLITNGPYRLVEHRAYERISVERNAYDDRPAKLRRIEFYPIDNRASEEMAYLSGRLDVTMSLPLNKVAAYQGRPELRIDPALQVEYITINTRRPPLDKPEVRRALSMAIDRQALCTQILRAGQAPAYSIVPPQLADVGPTAATTYNPAAARAIIEKLTPAEKMALGRMSYSFNTSEARRAVAESLQAQWQQHLGIKIKLDSYEWKTYLSRRSNAEYDLARAGWSADIADAGDFLGLLDASNLNNTTGWSYPSEGNLSPAEATARKIGELDAGIPIIPLYTSPNVYLCSPRVTGWGSHLLDWRDWRSLALR